jgi:hypothetical protein
LHGSSKIIYWKHFFSVMKLTLFLSGNKKTGHSIFAHSRPDKIGAPRLLPHPPHIPPYQGGDGGVCIGLSAKEAAQILYPAITESGELIYCKIVIYVCICYILVLSRTGKGRIKVGNPKWKTVKSKSLVNC